VLKGRKTSNIERLEPVGGMSRYIERYYIVLLIVFLEFYRMVALIPIEDKKPEFTNRTYPSILIKVLNPF
jgi:hypothetical protein